MFAPPKISSPLRASTFYITISNHKPQPFVIELDGKDLDEMSTVRDLLAFARAEHEATCECSHARARASLLPQVLLGDTIGGRNLRQTEILGAQRHLDKDSLSRRSGLRFIVEFQPSKRSRSPSPVDGSSRRLAPVTQATSLVYRVVDRKMRRTSLGNGDWYQAVRESGTTIFDTTLSLESFDSGSLLRGDSKLCLMFSSPSPYMRAHVSTLLPYFHDLARAKEWATFCQPLSMVQAASQTGVVISHSMHLSLTFDFSDWAEPLRKIPDESFAMPSVPEVRQSFEKSFIRFLRRAVMRFMHDYGGSFNLFETFPFLRSTQIVPQFWLWVQKHVPGHKLFIVVRDIECVLGRPIRASVWQDYEAESLTHRVQFVRQSLIGPIWESYLAEDGVVQKLLFTGSYLPDWLRDDAASAGGQIIDLASVGSLAGLTARHLQGGFRPITTAHLKHCNILREVASAPGLIRLYSPESALAVAPGLDALAKQDPGEQYQDTQKEGIVCKSFVTDAGLELAAAMLFPLLLRQEGALASLETLLAEGGSLPVLGTAPAPARLAISDIVGDDSPMQLLLTRGMVLGLLICQDGPTMTCKVAGNCARQMLLRVKKKVSDYPRKFWVRPRPFRAIGGKEDPLSQITLDVTETLDLDNITEHGLAIMILRFYHPSRAGNHPYNQPKNEHGFQGDFVHLICLAHVRASSKNFTSDVQDEVTLYCWVVDHVESGRLDVLYLRLLADGTYKLYIFELKYFHPMHTAHATHANVDGLPGAAFAGNYFKFYATFREVLDSIVDLPPHWYRGSERIGANPPSNLRLEDICCYYKPKQWGGAPAARKTAQATSSKAKATPSKKDSEPTTYKPPKKYELKDPITVMRGGAEQALKYRDAAAHGVQDAVPVAAPTVPGSAKLQLGLADWRITDMGPGRTEIVPFVVVNVAGSLAGVEKLPSTVLDRKLGFVNAHPWTGTRTELQVQAMYEARKAYKPPTD